MLTTRGTPHLYYGTEILMKNFKNPSDAEVRQDFPGGWPDDKENKFLATQRTPKENEAFNFVKNLAHYRQGSSALQTGKLTQFLPQDGIYVYFRHDTNQSIMVIMSQNKDEKTLNTARFEERLKGFSTGKDIISGTTVSNLKEVKVSPMSIQVIELGH